MMNRLKTTLLLSLLTVLMFFMGSAVGGKGGLLFTLERLIKGATGSAGAQGLMGNIQ